MPAGRDTRSVADLPEPVLRRELERILRLQPWYPWWKLKCPLPGIGAGLIIVGAHMDSTAGFEPGYSAPSDAAPGRDDNGSGLAGVLTLARHFKSLQGKLTHTLRFCLFNAEESGLVGSKAYASHLKALGAPIRAVICMDMIGYNSDQNRIFEVHAGYTDPAIRDLSIPLAEQVAAAAAEYGTLAPAQIYKGTGYGGAPDRTVYDGAINRSDHAAFQQQGYGAVLVSEDFFVNLASEPGSDSNPNYHRTGDQVIDTAYARDIVCAVARAVTRLAL
jgi:leucyl aminopeptidase